jgi:type I restriction enzyme S subunit
VEYRKLGDCARILDSQRKPVTKGKRTNGVYPYYGANGIQDYVADYIFDGDYLLIGEDGSVINPDKSPVLNWASGKFWVNNHAHILAENLDIALLRYLFYALQKSDVSDIVRGIPPKLNQVNLRNIEIPIPPLAVQEEIVKILDRFAEYTAELQARKEQYEYYRNLLLTFNPSASGYGADDGQKINDITVWGGA